MAYPAPHKLLSFGGPLYGTEQWSCSIRFSDTGLGGNAADAAELDSIYPVLAAWWQARSEISNSASLAWCKWNRIGTDGRYTQGVTNMHEWMPVLAPSGPGAINVPQASVVATFETGITRGLAAKGRIFLPAPSFKVETDGRLTPIRATAYATAVAQLLDSLNALPNIGPAVVASNVREGAERPIVAVNVGRVIDTMRSRRTALGEDRPASVAVAGP